MPMPFFPSAETPSEVAKRGHAAGGVQGYKCEADGAVNPPGDVEFFVLFFFPVFRE